MLLKMGDVCNFEFLGRKNHVALEWKGRIIILGGWAEKERPCLPSHVPVFCNGKWRCMKTTGRTFIAEENVLDIPEEELLLLSPRTARVVGDKVATIYDVHGILDFLTPSPLSVIKMYSCV